MSARFFLKNTYLKQLTFTSATFRQSSFRSPLEVFKKIRLSNNQCSFEPHFVNLDWEQS